LEETKTSGQLSLAIPSKDSPEATSSQMTAKKTPEAGASLSSASLLSSNLVLTCVDTQIDPNQATGVGLAGIGKSVATSKINDNTSSDSNSNYNSNSNSSSNSTLEEPLTTPRPPKLGAPATTQREAQIIVVAGKNLLDFLRSKKTFEN
jgi:hypothetical protein